MLSCIVSTNVLTSCSSTMMLFLDFEIQLLMTLTTVLYMSCCLISGPFFFFSSRRRHTISLRDWSSDVCSSDLICELCASIFLPPAAVLDLKDLHEDLSSFFAALIRRAGCIERESGPGDTLGGQFSKTLSRSEERRVGKESGSGGWEDR